MVYVNVKATAQSRRTGRTALVKTRRVVRHGCTHAQRATGTIAIVEFIGLEWDHWYRCESTGFYNCRLVISYYCIHTLDINKLETSLLNQLKVKGSQSP